MACFFRKHIASKLSKALRQPEETFSPSLFAVPVSKKQQSPDFRLSVSSLLKNSALSPEDDIQTKTEALVQQLKPDTVVEEISVGRGAINFRISRSVLAEKILEKIHREGHLFGVRSELFNSLQKGRTLVEYSSPNIAKKFHAGHLRSTIIGNFIANLKEAVGNEVIRINYLGDWGMQFGLLGAGFQHFGSQEKLKVNPLQHLFDVYVRVNREAESDEGFWLAAREFFRCLEQGEERALSLWKQFREITVEEYQRVYKRLGVHFDVYSGESFHLSGTVEVLQQLKDQGLLQISKKGTGVVDLSLAKDMSFYSTVMRSDGTSLYITRDLAAAIARKETYAFDEMIYVTDKSQGSHFEQMFQILQAMGHEWATSCLHVPFGLVQGMRTRQGDVVFLEDVLDEARARMLRNMKESKTTKDLEDPEDTAQKVGISALIVQDFKGPLISDYKFSWDQVLQAQGNTGVFLQYTHARLCSLRRMHESSSEVTFDPQLLKEQCSISILQHLLRYDEVLYRSIQDLQPKHLVNFLITLSHLVATAHRTLPVKGSPPSLAEARMQLFKGTRIVLANGMRILGITPVEMM
ncbi:hypothetical protein GJAV_G00119510 [Gymnothorax javanicus]|nr:hypothetical protein GJAV_G00119510 [Gymnothorax javanicus]